MDYTPWSLMKFCVIVSFGGGGVTAPPYLCHGHRSCNDEAAEPARKATDVTSWRHQMWRHQKCGFGHLATPRQQLHAQLRSRERIHTTAWSDYWTATGTEGGKDPGPRSGCQLSAECSTHLPTTSSTGEKHLIYNIVCIFISFL